MSVTYCPLCNSAVAYDRRLADGRVLDFGTSGLLWNSALVMYDRQTETLWSHFTGAGVLGALTGVLGSMQALEVIREIVGMEGGLTAKLLLYDARAPRFDTLTYRWNPDNPLNGTRAAAEGVA